MKTSHMKDKNRTDPYSSIARTFLAAFVPLLFAACDVAEEDDDGSDAASDADTDTDTDAGTVPDPLYRWHTFYGAASGEFPDEGLSVAVAGDGGIFVAGESSDWTGPAGESPLHAHTGSWDVFVLKLDPTGAYQWHTFAGSSVLDAGGSLAVDDSGDIYVSGYSEDTWSGPDGESPLHAHSGSYDVFVLKLDSTGAYQWHTFAGSSGLDSTSSLAVDGSGNIYVSGDSEETWSGPNGESPLHAHSGFEDGFLLALDSSGAYQWHTFYYALNNSVAVDSNGNVYMAGTCITAWDGPNGESPLYAHSGGSDLALLQLDSSGAYRWHAFVGSTSGDDGGSLAVDDGGNLYMAGQSGATWSGPDGESPLHAHSGSYDVFVLKLDSTGAYQWHTFYGSSNDLTFDIPNAVAVDAGGRIYVTGQSGDTWSGPSGESPLHAHAGGCDDQTDSFVLELSSSGEYGWHTFYGSTSNDSGASVAVDGDGDIYATGKARNAWAGPSGEDPLHAYTDGWDLFVLKLAE